MTWKIFLVVWETFIVNSTSWAHVLPSSFIKQVASCASPRAWILLIDSTIFCQSVYNLLLFRQVGHWQSITLLIQSCNWPFHSVEVGQVVDSDKNILNFRL